MPIPCHLCGVSDTEEIRSRDRHGDPLRSVICRRCGLVWTDPRPSPEEVRQFYARQYRVEYKGASDPRPRQRYRNANVAIARVRTLREFLERDARILDVGAGSGEMVYMLRAIGCDASGIEPNEAYARYAAESLKLPITTGFYQDAAIAPGTLDVVTMYHTVEHLEQPRHAMDAAYRWLKPGGRLVVEVPNVEATCQRPDQQFHRGHLHHFNLTTLSAVANQAGFTVTVRWVSPDGGNIAIIATKEEAPVPAGDLAGNHARVAGVLRSHTPLRHLFSRHPWIRPLRKLGVRADEYAHTFGTRSAEALLDDVLRRSGVSTLPPRQPSQSSGIPS